METDSEGFGSEDHLVVEEDDSATEQEISEDETPIQLDVEPENKAKKNWHDVFLKDKAILVGKSK